MESKVSLHRPQVEDIESYFEPDESNVDFTK
jgi:hypothetical protein